MRYSRSLAIGAPRGYRLRVAQSFDPFGLVGRAVDAARLGLDVYSWTEQQIVGALRKGLNELEPEDLSLIHISEPTRLSLVSRMPSSA